ncbi:MAG TPA: hypothetical protein VM509_14240 [Planctomycetota bacterium]|nr:hypothetical protein [Planctomycetota bacterium]
MASLRHSARRALAFALLLLLAMGQTAAAVTLYKCRGDGVERQTCCCPKRDSQESSQLPSVSRVSCCAVRVVGGESVRADVQLPVPVDVSRFALVATAASSVIDFPGETAIGFVGAMADAHPPRSPPLILVKHSRLI